MHLESSHEKTSLFCNEIKNLFIYCNRFIFETCRNRMIRFYLRQFFRGKQHNIINYKKPMEIK